MNIAISGASGFIGSALTNSPSRCGHKIIPLERKHFNEDTRLLADILSSCDVIINLAGATINKRWTADYKEEIINSRILTTRKITDALSRLTDNSTFLAKVCQEWEKEALKSINAKM